MHVRSPGRIFIQVGLILMMPWEDTCFHVGRRIKHRREYTETVDPF